MTCLRMLCLAAGFALAAPIVVCEPAQAQLDINIGIAPPPERVETPPPPPPNPSLYVWEKGHWRWNGVTHVWMPGRYIRLPHPGAVRIPGHWIQLPSGQWHFVAPHWE